MSPAVSKLARVVFLGLALTLAIPALAAADAPDVMSATGSVVSVDPVAGTRTIEVHGDWTWWTHTTNCNSTAFPGVAGPPFAAGDTPKNERAGIGIAIDWGDNPKDGNHVTTLGLVSIDVGVKNDTSGLNPLFVPDNLVYPAIPVLNSLDGAGNFKRPTGIADWNGTCGNYAVDARNQPDGSPSDGKKHPTGTFGVDANGGFFLTHTYPIAARPQICAIVYDVHGKDNKPSGVKEITAGESNHNTDNSAEKNAQTPGGNTCVNVVLISTTPSASTIPAGGTVSDSATLENLNNTANGTVDFKLYGPNPADCNGAPAFSSLNRPISGGPGTYTASGAAVGPVTLKGTYYWVASYTPGAGDTNVPASGPCLDATEKVVVGEAITTQWTNTTADNQDPITVGDTQKFRDTATLVGADNTANGTITFKLFLDDNTCAPGSAVTSFGTAGSEDVALDTVTHKAASTPFEPAAAGTYYFQASYTPGVGDANAAVPLTTCGDAGEFLDVGPAGPGVKTTASAATTLGKSISDSATISGLAAASPFGTISFDVYGPNDTDCDGIDDTDLVTAVPFTHVGDVAVTGDGAYSSDDTANGGSVFTPTKAGTYVWVANYSGDANNSPTTNPCDDTANGSVEHTVVSSPPKQPDNPQPPARHPGIQIDKTGPATAQAGAVVAYLLAVTNTGDQSFLEAKVVLSDPVCGATPTLVNPGGKNGDTTPDSLDQGETWYYTCSVQTALGQTNVHNVGSVTGTDEKGDVVSDDDPADTVLNQPAQAVLPLLPGSARLRGPAGCLAGGPHKLVVTGRRIATVTFFLDGKKVATKKKADSHGRFTYTVNRKHLRTGIHRIVARVTYLPETTGGQRTFRRTFAKCAKALKPEFTG